MEFCGWPEDHWRSSHRLCIQHFKDEDLKLTGRFPTVQPGAVPCIYSVPAKVSILKNVTENIETGIDSSHSIVVTAGEYYCCLNILELDIATKREVLRIHTRRASDLKTSGNTFCAMGLRRDLTSLCVRGKSISNLNKLIKSFIPAGFGVAFNVLNMYGTKFHGHWIVFRLATWHRFLYVSL